MKFVRYVFRGSSSPCPGGGKRRFAFGIWAAVLAVAILVGSMGSAFATEGDITFLDPTKLATGTGITKDTTDKTKFTITQDNYEAIEAQTDLGTAGTTKWYVVKADKTIANAITVKGTVNLILVDGKTLAASGGITLTKDSENEATNEATLNIYAGNTDSTVASSGALTVAGINGDGTLVINGGAITANGVSHADDNTTAGQDGGAGAPGIDVTALTVNGGTVNATGGAGGKGGDATEENGNGGAGGAGADGIVASGVEINGGTVNATGGAGSAGGNGKGTGNNGSGGDSGNGITVNTCSITISNGELNATGDSTTAAAGSGGTGSNSATAGKAGYDIAGSIVLTYNRAADTIKITANSETDTQKLATSKTITVADNKTLTCDNSAGDLNAGDLNSSTNNITLATIAAAGNINGVTLTVKDQYNVTVNDVTVTGTKVTAGTVTVTASPAKAIKDETVTLTVSGLPNGYALSYTYGEITALDVTDDEFIMPADEAITITPTLATISYKVQFYKNATTGDNTDAQEQAFTVESFYTDETNNFSDTTLATLYAKAEAFTNESLVITGWDTQKLATSTHETAEAIYGTDEALSELLSTFEADNTLPLYAVWGNAPVSYVDPSKEEGQQDQSINDYTELTNSTITPLAAGWWVVKGGTKDDPAQVNLTSLSINGTVNLIVCNNATLTVTGDVTGENTSVLNIYYQSTTGEETEGVFSVEGTVKSITIDGEAYDTNGKSTTSYTVTFDPDTGAFATTLEADDTTAGFAFDTDNKKLVQTVHFTYGGNALATQPTTTLTPASGTFDNWYLVTDENGTLSATAYDFNTPVTKNITLKAKYTSSGSAEDTLEKELTEGNLDLNKAHIIRHSMVLGGNLSVIFYVYFPTASEDWRKKALMKFDVNGDTSQNGSDGLGTSVTNYTATVTGSNHTLYGYQCFLTSVQMGDKITATLMSSDKTTVLATNEDEDYSAETYLNDLIEATGLGEAAVNLGKAIRNYAYYAQVMLKDVHHWEDKHTAMTAPTGTDVVTAITANDVKNYEIKLYAKGKDTETDAYDLANDANIDSMSFSLLLSDDTTIRLYVKPKATGTTITATENGDTHTLTDKGTGDEADYVYFDIGNISAHLLGTKHTVTIKATPTTGDNDATEFDVHVSALSYAYAVMTNNDYKNDTNLVNAVSALKAYFDAVTTYNDYTKSDEYVGSTDEGE